MEEAGVCGAGKGLGTLAGMSAEETEVGQGYPTWRIVRDLENASKKGKLTPSFLDDYAVESRAQVLHLYALAEKNFLEVEHEEGRNDHVLDKTWETKIDWDTVARRREAEALEYYRTRRNAREDGRPSALRNRGRNSLWPNKPSP
jgi:hypothetical protein